MTILGGFIIASCSMIIGIIVGGLLAGGKCQDLERQLCDKKLDNANYLRQACDSCYEIKQLRKANAALRGDNKKIHTLIQGDPKGARVLYDLWAAKNPVSGRE